MQVKNWNDLRYLLALQRGRNISGAARLMGVDDTTVSRRLAVLQSEAGSALFVRAADGGLTLTARGSEIARNIEAMERQADLIGEALGPGKAAVAGSVRVTSVPIIINRILAPGAGVLLQRHPDIELELVPESRNLSLTRREADLALRLARPTTGGAQVKARRIGELAYSVYVSRDTSEAAAGGLPWITYEDAMSHIAQAKWIARETRRTGSPLSGLRVADGETALEAVAAGVGRSLLADAVASRRNDLRKMRNDSGQALPRREIWLLGHGDQMHLGRIRAVNDWIGETIARAVAG